MYSSIDVLSAQTGMPPRSPNLGRDVGPIGSKITAHGAERLPMAADTRSHIAKFRAMAARERELSQSGADPHAKALHGEAARSWDKWADELEKVAKTAEHIDATTQRIMAEIGPSNVRIDQQVESPVVELARG